MVWWVAVSQWEQSVKIWLDERRQVTHSLKVGLALGLVSFLLLLEDSYHRLGENAIWAVMTVVVIFEYTVGATLSKGLNRGLGTLLAAMLGLLVDFIANKSGPKVEPYIIGFTIFTLGSVATFCRFVPKIKAKFDYAVLIFILTYCLVVVSGYRVPDSFDLVFDRLLTVVVGAAICLAISFLLFPIWAGEDLHLMVVHNFDALATTLEECVTRYFESVPALGEEVLSEEDDLIYKSYRKILDGKQIEESMANFASWEPRHGSFRYKYPWKRYVEVGSALRHCAYTVSSLHGCLNSEIQASDSLRSIFSNSCINLAKEISGVIRELATDIRMGQLSKPKEVLLKKLNNHLECLHEALDSHPSFLYGDRADEGKPKGQLGARAALLVEVAGTHEMSKHSNHTDRKKMTMKANLWKSASMNDSYQNSKDRVPFILDCSIRRYSAHCIESFAQALSIATVASLLVEFAARLDQLVDAVERLQEEAGFKEASMPLLMGLCDEDNVDKESQRQRHSDLSRESSRNERRYQHHSSMGRITE